MIIKNYEHKTALSTNEIIHEITKLNDDHFLIKPWECIYMRRQDAYTQAVHIGGATPRETEILAFGLCNARLRTAVDAGSRIDALNKTHQLWSLLVRDLAGNANKLPPNLKKQLVDIGFWAMSFSVSAMGREISLQPLIEVNQNIIDGLRMQPKEQCLPQLSLQAMPFSAAEV